jgi:hypothetical protein
VIIHRICEHVQVLSPSDNKRKNEISGPKMFKSTMKQWLQHWSDQVRWINFVVQQVKLDVSCEHEASSSRYSLLSDLESIKQLNESMKRLKLTLGHFGLEVYKIDLRKKQQHEKINTMNHYSYFVAYTRIWLLFLNSFI